MTAQSWNGEPYIRAAILYGLHEIMRPVEWDASETLQRVGIDPAALTDPDMLISWPRHGVLMELIAAEHGKPSLGIELALSMPPHFPNVGPIVFLAQLVDTLGAWIEQTIRYWRFHTNAYLLQVVDDVDTELVCLRFWQGPLIIPPRQQMELSLASCLHMGRIVTGNQELAPARVCFRHEAPDDTTVHARHFRCSLEFGAEQNEIWFERKYLASPTSGRLKSLKSIIDSFIRYRIRHMPLYDQSVRTTTETAIRSVLGSGMCSKEFIAESMGVTPRKLHRLLAAEETSFADLLDETRRAMAQRLLTQTGVPISAIAGLLEYSTTSALTLAMKRWTNMTATEYRARIGQLQANEPNENYR